MSLNYESEPGVDVTVTVTDDQGATVHDIDEAPDPPSLTLAASNLMVEDEQVDPAIVPLVRQRSNGL